MAVYILGPIRSTRNKAATNSEKLPRIDAFTMRFRGMESKAASSRPPGEKNSAVVKAIKNK